MARKFCNLHKLISSLIISNLVLQSLMNMKWIDYEDLIYKHLQRKFPRAVIQKNVKRIGILSGIERQIDILCTSNVLDQEIVIVFECKYYSSKLDIKNVESFLSMLADLKVSKGVMITNVGYTRGAIERTLREPQDIKLEILDFEDLESFHGFYGGIAHKDENGLIFPCPMDWELHPNPPISSTLAVFSRPGKTWQEAFIEKEVIYLDLASKSDFPVMQDLIAFHEKETAQKFPGAQFSYEEFINVFSINGTPSVLRTGKYQQYKEIEISAIVEFEKFYAFFVMYVSHKVAEREKKRLAFLVKKSIPIRYVTTK